MQIRAIGTPTIKSCDPEDLGDVDSDDIQAARGSFGEDSDHHLKELRRCGGRVEMLANKITAKKGGQLYSFTHKYRNTDHVCPFMLMASVRRQIHYSGIYTNRSDIHCNLITFIEKCCFAAPKSWTQRLDR